MTENGRKLVLVWSPPGSEPVENLFPPDITEKVPPDLAPPAPDPVPLDPDEVAAVLALPLARLDRLLEVRVKGLPVTLWFVPGEVDGEALLADGISRGRIWTVKDLQDCLSIKGLSSSGIQYLAKANLLFELDLSDVKRLFAGTLVGIEPSGARAWAQMKLPDAGDEVSP
jgi:hypothetical protein